MINASVVTIDILGGYQGGAEPWERAASLRIDSEDLTKLICSVEAALARR